MSITEKHNRLKNKHNLLRPKYGLNHDKSMSKTFLLCILVIKFMIIIKLFMII